MNDKKFKIGDVVNLKSGGPDMTIVAIDEDIQIVECAWHLGIEPKSAKYPIAAIELSEGTEYD